ncbi:MAG: glycosyltransferase [Desulfuromonas sp.]|nr:glycosyltransferase [Desulfuromonas sp.]
MNVIFHHPLPLDRNAKSASGIRPLRMLAAFENLGCEVDLVTGYSGERKRSIARIKKNINDGAKYDFVYSESSTMPTVLTDPHHFPLHPLIDWLFLRFCSKNDIPIGLFYRDIYWLFDSYGAGLSPIKTAVAKTAYRFDLWVYQQVLKKLYLPSLEMGGYVPKINPDIFAALPPGHATPSCFPHADVAVNLDKLKLFYVGGLSSHYQLHKLFTVVRELPEVEFTLCTREAEWHAVKNEYPTLTSNIHVIHATGVVMEEHLQAADIAILFVKPQEYWQFASPVKLYEYLGYQKPILASEGTLVGRFVNENGVGWSIPYDESALKELLQSFLSKTRDWSRVIANLKLVATQHSWEARAKQVIKDLTQ